MSQHAAYSYDGSEAGDVPHLPTASKSPTTSVGAAHSGAAMCGRSGGGTHRESVDGLENLPKSKGTLAFLQAVLAGAISTSSNPLSRALWCGE